MRLRDKSLQLIRDTEEISAHNGPRLLELLESHPIADVPFIANMLDISANTARNLVNAFVAVGILVQRGAGKKRYRTYVYEEYMGILREGGKPL